MRIVKILAEQHPKTALRTTLGTMQSLEADETTVGGKEEVGVRTSQTRKHIESYTIHSNEYGSRETRLWEELYPMYVVVIGHDPLNYPTPLHRLTPLYLGNGYGSITAGISTNSGTMETRGRTWDQRIPAERLWDTPELYPTG
jgi:hypothetical protein